MPEDQVELLETCDIFDLYGCDYLLNAPHAHKRQVESDERELILFRINEIHDKYIFSVRERIKAELVFCGVSEDDIKKGFTISAMVRMAEDLLQEEIGEQTDKMMFGGGFDMIGAMVKARQQSGGSMEGFDTKRLKKMGIGVSQSEETKDTSVEDHMEEGFFNNPKWSEIAQAFVDLENAHAVDQKIQTIDRLNDLQHNSFHLLIDLQTGRMLDDRSKGSSKGKHNEAVDVLKEVLDIKHGASNPKEFADKMTPEIRKLVRKCA